MGTQQVKALLNLTTGVQQQQNWPMAEVGLQAFVQNLVN
jgi:hypothetical protein